MWEAPKSSDWHLRHPGIPCPDRHVPLEKEATQSSLCGEAQACLISMRHLALLESDTFLPKGKQPTAAYVDRPKAPVCTNQIPQKLVRVSGKEKI
jgi:hypothetical protein